METAHLTPKGRATRMRIVEATADRILARGIGGTSLDDVRADSATSKSQLFHYFPEGKAELVRAVVSFQGERVLDVQRAILQGVDGWADWERWRDALLAHYGSQHGWGCPIGSLANEAAATDALLSAQLVDYLHRWIALLADAVERMRAAGSLRPDADPHRLATATLAAVQGALILTQTEQALWPLEAGLDAALANLRSWAAPTS
jgi:AcrR family transcriptional regulator